MPYATAEESPLVLIVEDEEAIITLLDYNLRNAGYLTAIARDGEEAVDLARSLEPNAILLDWMLPLRSGLEVCRHLRRAPETSEVPIIMLTARGEEQDKLRGLDMGADDYLTKPFSPQELLARLRAVIRRAQPARLKEVLTFDNHYHGPEQPPRDPRRPTGGAGADRIPPAAALPAVPRTGVLARATAGRRLGPGEGHRSPHGRRSH